MPAAEGGGKKGKKGVTLPPKPALYTDEQWALAHNVTGLLELLSLVEKGSAAKEKPIATKQTVGLPVIHGISSDCPVLAQQQQWP
jgi:hypothetical protein